MNDVASQNRISLRIERESELKERTSHKNLHLRNLEQLK